MQTDLMIVKDHTEPVTTIDFFGDYLELFRQDLIGQNYSPRTIWVHIRCVKVLAEAMKGVALTPEQLDEPQGLELIAKTGWMLDRSTYPALIVKRFVRFLVKQGVAKPPSPVSAKELVLEELRLDYVSFLCRQRGAGERTASDSWRFASSVRICRSIACVLQAQINGLFMSPSVNSRLNVWFPAMP